LAASERQSVRPEIENLMAETYTFSSRVARVLRPPSIRYSNDLVADYVDTRTISAQRR
jgi:hypothetical protein